MSQKSNNSLRAKYIDIVRAMLEQADEEVLQVASNEIAIPTVDDEGNETFVTFVVKVPTGSRDGDEYDGYGLAEQYADNQRKKAEKAKEKAKKAAKDKEKREKKVKK